jgi:hypothetical protein
MRKKLLTALAACALIFGGSISAQASTYQIINVNGLSWGDARTQAQALGAGWDLASITSQAEFDTVAALLGTSYNDRDEYWIGGERVGSTMVDPDFQTEV